MVREAARGEVRPLAMIPTLAAAASCATKAAKEIIWDNHPSMLTRPKVWASGTLVAMLCQYLSTSMKDVLPILLWKAALCPWADLFKDDVMIATLWSTLAVSWSEIE